MKQVLVALVTFFCLPCIAQKALRDSWVLVRQFGGEIKLQAGVQPTIGGGHYYAPRGMELSPAQDQGYRLRVRTISGALYNSCVGLEYFNYSHSSDIIFPDKGPVGYYIGFLMDENPQLIEFLNSSGEVIQSRSVEAAPFVFPPQPIYRLDGQNLWVDPAIQSISLLAPKERGAQVFTRADDFPQGVLTLSAYRWKFASESFLVVDVMQDLWLSHWEARLADLPMKPK